jgi:phosphatidylglycerol---prolipoprotein diacylglyceryl transferase
MHPQLLHFGRLVLPTFGVLAAVGLMAGLSMSLRTAAKLGLSPDRVWNAGLFTLLAAFVLSRLLLIVANLQTFLAYPLIMLAVPSLTAGGVLLTAIAAAIYIWLHQLPLLRVLDAWAPCATLIWAFLALGHLAEGSDPGLITTVPWSIASPSGLTRLHPVALYAAIAAVVITLVLLKWLSACNRPGQIAALALMSAGAAQFLITFYRQPSFDELPERLAFLDPIQWAGVGMIVAAGLLLLRQPTQIYSRKPVSDAL